MHLLIDMHRVLSVPELLGMIFGFLDNASIASNACVCKQWSEIALDYLWHDVDDFWRLFNLLSPISKDESGNYHFSRIPDAGDWTRFERYSRRVRRLLFQTGTSKDFLPQSIFDNVARSRTSFRILPHLHTLQWNQSLPLSVMFMHDSVKHFVFEIPSEIVEEKVSLHPFVLDVIARMPKLTTIDFRMTIAMSSIEEDIINLLECLPKLKKAIFPRFCVTSRIAEALSHHDDLEVIEFQYHDEQGCGDPTDMQKFAPTLSEGAFPALWDLSLTIRFVDAARFLDTAVRNLTMLHIDSPLSESPSDIHNALAVIADNCQLLMSLALISEIEVSAYNHRPSAEDRISFETLKPLLACPNLVSFELLHQYALNLVDEEVDEIARKWPSLRTLSLNPEPAACGSSPLTLKALIPFAKHCPELGRLGLFLRASAADLPSSYQAEAFVPFQKLTLLSMGLSIIAEEGPVSLFLSKICPLGCALESGITWEDNISATGEFEAEMARRCERWDKVAELLPLLTKLRVEERERSRSLQAEVEDLRTRARIFMVHPNLHTHDTCLMS